MNLPPRFPCPLGPSATVHRPLRRDKFGNMIHLFSYGTLQQDGVQMASFGRLLKGAPDALPGWKSEMVEITNPEVLAKSGMRFHPIVVPGGASDEVAGMVLEITE